MKCACFFYFGPVTTFRKHYKNNIPVVFSEVVGESPRSLFDILCITPNSLGKQIWKNGNIYESTVSVFYFRLYFCCDLVQNNRRDLRAFIEYLILALSRRGAILKIIYRFLRYSKHLPSQTFASLSI